MKTQSRDTSPKAERVQLALLRAASPAKRFGLVEALSRMVLQSSRARLRRTHPRAVPHETALLALAHIYGRPLRDAVRSRMEGCEVMPVAPDLYAAMAP